MRRLDATDDWVRQEIATALKLEKPVLPVLFQGAAFPSCEDLPENLRKLGFHKCQAYPISERRWDDDARDLVASLTRFPKLKTLSNIETPPPKSELERLRNTLLDALTEMNKTNSARKTNLDELNDYIEHTAGKPTWSQLLSSWELIAQKLSKLSSSLESTDQAMIIGAGFQNASALLRLSTIRNDFTIGSWPWESPRTLRKWSN